MRDKRVKWEVPSKFQGGVITEGLCGHIRLRRQTLLETRKSELDSQAIDRGEKNDIRTGEDRKEP